MAVNERESQNRDLTLPPDTYMFMQNVGKGGLISVYRGPTVVNQTGQDQPVVYDSVNRKYRACELHSAVQQSPRANEGDYVVLENPTEDGQFPAGATQQGRELKKGRKVILAGPWSEALWPGQVATVIEGHRLRSNQYLVGVVYNAEEAEKNWEKGVVAKAQTESTGDPSKPPVGDPSKPNTTIDAATATKQSIKGLPKPESFAVGTRIIIKGSDVSFFIPCTGVEVLRDEKNAYVREAVTLEQLEYCCLIDENGKKEYPRGPAVVFPKPTQQFETDSKSRRKFKPIELNNINGIHLKVTANFKGFDIEDDPDKERDFREGEELFVTGKTLSIYYPREELSVIEYGQGNKKHYSTAVPKGEGRYVINRETGEIHTEKGPKMLLADPRKEIPVRRVLSPDECSLWYPGNKEAILYNADLAEAMAESPSGRSGIVSEGDYRKRQAKKMRSAGPSAGAEAYLGAAVGLSDSYSPEEVGDEGGATGSITRGTKFTEPRTLTLNTKYDGVPKIEVWPGYAVLIVGAEGDRRVVQGPEVILLNYDQKLGHMDLSMGKPKSTDKLFRTAYLCTHNNQVGDIVSFESKDHVKGNVKISLRVNFEGGNESERLRWFSVSNYVKFLCDHVRSIVAGMAKKQSIADIKSDYINLVRDAILGLKATGEPRTGLVFEANGMRVVEVEVLELSLADQSIAKLLDAAQHKVVQTNIELDDARKTLEATKEKENILQQTVRSQHETVKIKNDLLREQCDDQITLLAKQVEVELEKLSGDRQKTEQREAITDFSDQKKLERAKAEADHMIGIDKEKLALKKDEMEASTSSAVKRFEAAKDGLYEVLLAMHRDDLAVKLAEGCTIERWLSGDSQGSAIGNLLSISPVLSEFFDKAKSLGDAKANGNRLKEREPVATK
jgi:major vault protein